MRQVLDNAEAVHSFVDDVLGHTKTWNDHLQVLEKLFQRLRSAGLTIKPSKCFLGYENVDFLGHHITKGELMTQKDKVEKMKNLETPTTKKQLRSFLGLAGYYRKFIPHYAEKAKPLTDLTKGRSPNKLPWSQDHSQAYQKLKDELCREPVLKLPDLSKPFVLRTDASDVGLGAVLLQEHNEELFPVMYASKKLLPRETKYATLEKECMAVVWAVNKFQVYLYGKEFIIQTDHKSLEYLNSARHNNARVMRWAMSLQPYKFLVEAIKGVENVGADLLSRL